MTSSLKIFYNVVARRAWANEVITKSTSINLVVPKFEFFCGYDVFSGGKCEIGRITVAVMMLPGWPSRALSGERNPPGLSPTVHTWPAAPGGLAGHQTKTEAATAQCTGIVQYSLPLPDLV